MLLRCQRLWFLKSFGLSRPPFLRFVPNFKRMTLPSNRFASCRGLVLSLSFGSVSGFALSKGTFFLPHVSCDSGHLETVVPMSDDFEREKFSTWNYGDILLLIKPDLLEFFGAILVSGNDDKSYLFYCLECNNRRDAECLHSSLFGRLS